MGTTSPEGYCNPLKVTINAVKATGDELHRMKLAVRMIAGGRHPPWGAARRVRHVILRISWDGLNLVVVERHLKPKRRERGTYRNFSRRHAPVLEVHAVMQTDKKHPCEDKHADNRPED